MSNYIAVDTDDLEENPVTLAEIPSFVRMYFGDNTDGRHVPNERETEMLGLNAYRKIDPSSVGETIYVEDAITGEFLPVVLTSKNIGDKFASPEDPSGGADSSEGASDAVDETDYNVIVDPFSDDGSTDIDHVQYITFLRIVFVFIQGILAGFSFVTVYVQATGGSDALLLENYADSANEYRRFFYVLSTLAVIGSGDLLMTLPKRKLPQGKGRDSQASNRNELVFVSFVAFVGYFICLLCSLGMGITDTLIFYEDGQSVSSDASAPSWADLALANDSFFSSSYDMWRILGYLRFASAFVGFIGSCFILWAEFIGFHDKELEIGKLKLRGAESQRRIAELCGEKLGDLNILELQSLLSTQKLGMERTQEALSAFGE